MEISQVLRDQRQELEEGFASKRIVAREAAGSFRNARESKLVKVVTGVRRCGKSVFSHELVRGEPFAYATFDDDRLSGVEPDAILSGFYEVYGNKGFKRVLLDEIQYLDGWERFVNRLHRTGFNVVITGSNAKLLSRELSTHLTGRHMRIELFPFSFRECLSAAGFAEDIQTTRGQVSLKRELRNYLDCGGFPDVVVGKEIPRIFLRELYRSIIERDVVSRHGISYVKTFKEIALSIMGNPGRYVSFNKLRRQFNLGSEHTVKNYLSYLEEAYLIFTLNRFSFKPAEVEKSDKKIYAIDPGLLTVLSSRPTGDFGRAYENTVAIELLRRKSLQPEMEFYYWKGLLGEEVDFVVKEGARVRQLIQVCFDPGDPDTKKREVRALIGASKQLKCPDLLVITSDFRASEKTRWRGRTFNIRYLPLHEWLLQKE